jgi:hypothetical protein
MMDAYLAEPTMMKLEAEDTIGKKGEEVAL